MKQALVSAIVILGVSMLVACGRNDEYNPDREMVKIRAEEGLDSPILEPTKEGFAISAPSDPGALYCQTSSLTSS